jgi:hypothetical protein
MDARCVVIPNAVAIERGTLSALYSEMPTLVKQVSQDACANTGAR